jgi:hypothetical protein
MRSSPKRLSAFGARNCQTVTTMDSFEKSLALIVQYEYRAWIDHTVKQKSAAVWNRSSIYMKVGECSESKPTNVRILCRVRYR